MASHGSILEAAGLSFPPVIQKELNDVLSKGAVISSDLAQSWMSSMGIDIGNLMIRLLPVAAGYARVPISGFHVGAVALGMFPSSPNGGPGSLYLGSNMEFSGQAVSFAVHGEQSATNHAWLHGEIGLQALAINAAPCGYCRQFLYELTTATKGFRILLKAKPDPLDDSYTTNPLTYFLPDAFGPQDLGVSGGLMKPESHGLVVSDGGSNAQAALGGANASYSPYTKDYCGVSLVAGSGSVFTGRYAENAAYNPSMSPLESALAFMNMSLPPQVALDVTQATLVESSSKISQWDATSVVLSSVAPKVSLQYLRAVVGSSD